jgi:hypothetical protein
MKKKYKINLFSFLNLPFTIGGVALKDDATVLREKLSRRVFCSFKF